ncbi:AAA family ATPase [Leucobacter sp. UCMA 4100]|uniref:MinD/ParA family ATP-binding protein n=1 Tax=Leucobacter sp. UCMA 4100 TaxID=2810534 RepID=UPI0022EAB724|nr:AAA family ATPase [Leucobacter sp. UCMA 4100]MDA3145762.1 AAA family ATPase [Leucobacter sp. UCMA 4100]
MPTTTGALDFPVIEAHTHEDGSGTFLVQGVATEIPGTDAAQTRSRLIELATAQAQQFSRPVKMTSHTPTEVFALIVHPDGDVTQEAGAPVNAAPRRPRPSGSAPDLAEVPQMEPEQEPEESPESPKLQRARGEERYSFLKDETVEKPATKGVRGILSRAGIRVAPSDDERAERAAEQAVSQHWPGPRTIAVVNGKGGAGKTPTVVLLSAVFARYGGAGVLAWDNNQTRGTLGWRTEQGPHESTLLELLPEAQRLLGPGAQVGDLAHFVHHQTKDKYDVLRSKPMALAHEQRVSSDDVDSIASVATKYYRLIFIDSGNDESDPMWLRMIDSADQIVVATTTRSDHAEAGSLLLDALADRDEHSAKLAENAVAVITQADPKATKADMESIAAGYRNLVREVVQIPHDAAMVEGQLSFEALRPATQRAWLEAGAAVAGGLSRSGK